MRETVVRLIIEHYMEKSCKKSKNLLNRHNPQVKALSLVQSREFVMHARRDNFFIWI